ncbi:hypothetical protein GGTG_03656 [Gaeumannomyces tritici R3-111a-1]|uniref:Uncharacterized protein n=1 Tax=Gaeumannomyces tritici (strain R3-111a-1) TaxID=644352 RepID=J3NQV0_GAET3|nr:hypothetical protein GGTG_03656 [Gaeumannomyces tritici R3-111a-1]EJT78556.1 hypothetical protein GGTG_03656 [Gaeumannomyces tritici R3-111a-1]
MPSPNAQRRRTVLIHARYIDDFPLMTFLVRLFGANECEVEWKRGYYQCILPRGLKPVSTAQLGQPPGVISALVVSHQALGSDGGTVSSGNSRSSNKRWITNATRRDENPRAVALVNTHDRGPIPYHCRRDSGGELS